MSLSPSMEDALRSDIRPVCPRDNSVMVYQETYIVKTDVFHPSVIEGFLPSYGCAEPGCDARFRHTQGYFTLQGLPESPTMVPIGGLNIAKCPKHFYRLYMRARSGTERDISWCCAVRGCEHVQNSSDKPGTSAR